jgi:hypothetical protein
MLHLRHAIIKKAHNWRDTFAIHQFPESFIL